MNTDSVKRAFNQPVVVGFVMLLAGLLMGVAAERYSVRSAEGTTSLSVATRSLRDPASQLPAPDTLFPGTDDSWDPFREMRDLQAEMDRMFQRSISRFNSSPMMDPFKNDTGYSQSLDVRELKDRFEVRAYLPDAQATDTNVKLDGNRLQVEVTHRQANRLQDTNSVVNESALERYTQVADLPGRLNGSQMKVEQKDHELLITIPKAK
jgi:HSP20 family molecular chaperone IbpA